MIKKTITAALAAALLGLQLAGCGNEISQGENTDLPRETSSQLSESSESKSESAAEVSVNEYNVTVKVGQEYTADKLCGLVFTSSGSKQSYEDGSSVKLFDKTGKEKISIVHEDMNGIKSVIVLIVNVKDDIAPTFEGVKDITINQGETAELKKGVTVKDNYDKEIDFIVEFDPDDKDHSSVGKHNITYKAKDSAGNTAAVKAVLEIKAVTTTAKTTTKVTTQATRKPAPSPTPAPAPAPAPTPVITPLPSPKPAASSSSNVKFYQDKMVVAGDSIAFGFCSYGFIPYEHNLAQGSLAMRNYKEYGWFNVNGSQMRIMNAIYTVKPKLLYVSMGMNDVNITNAQTYANNYVNFIKEVRSRLPGCIIVAANITPIASTSNFTNINNIINCNNAMIKAVTALGDPNTILFDAYTVVSGGGKYMSSGYSAGDGIHLSRTVYPKLLNALAIRLDQYDVRSRL
ncbi:GDSL-type esterase/lipase family protein [Ruminococcus sp. FC2018]|uniref:GDSL-type esterase/lipase family protein n=1 Tax=Ruminococcus sp. FC2018 TaxID=1410617 RepID=UPI000490DF0D|nr:GDSL-type esterase/lipase family protein [Ruminococcus sp. FC2018]